MQWRILYINSRGTGKVRHLVLGKRTLVVFTVLACFGVLGLGRSVYLGGAYGCARFGGIYSEQVNKRLHHKLEVMESAATEKHAQMAKLVAFEDMSRFSYGMEAISPDIRMAGVGGLPNVTEASDARFARCADVVKADSLKTMVATLLRQAQLQDSTFNRVADHAQRQNERWQQRPSVWPASGTVTSGFGYRIHPIFGESMFHNGIDICGPNGTPIHAVADGIIVKAEYYYDYGNTIIVRHPASGYSTLFAHMSRLAVSVGEKVKRGELIGYMGATGRATGAHLHFSVICADQFLNPMDFLVPTSMIVD